MTSPKPVRSPEAPLDTSMRAKQLASTVRQGRAITISILDEEQISGYLCGWDNDTYFVILPSTGPTPVKMLVPKASILFIRLHDEQTFREEDDYLAMENVVKSFREWINNKYFPSPTEKK